MLRSLGTWAMRTFHIIHIEVRILFGTLVGTLVGILAGALVEAMVGTWPGSGQWS